MRTLLTAFLASCLFAADPLPGVITDALRDAARHSRSKEAQDLAKAAADHVRAGRPAEAIRLAQQAAAVEKAFGEAGASAKFDRIASDLDVQRVLQTLLPEQRASLTAFHVVAGPISRIAVVDADVRTFLSAFRRSADNPRAYLNQMNVEQRLKAGLWNMADPSKRVFLAGSGEDTPEVKRIKDQLEGNGYQVFFYKFCEGPTGALCDSEIVGSYFKSAGQCYLVDTAAAAQSRYVLREIQMALAIDQNKFFILMVTPQEIQLAQTAPVKVVVITLSNDSN
jgi:hypothetical protein